MTKLVNDIREWAGVKKPLKSIDFHCVTNNMGNDWNAKVVVLFLSHYFLMGL